MRAHIATESRHHDSTATAAGPESRRAYQPSAPATAMMQSWRQPFRLSAYNHTFAHNVNIFMCDCTLGGIAPTSPRVISLLVLDLTLRIHFKNQRNTLSMSLFALGDTPHTSLPYRNMGFISVSKIYSINLGGRAPIFLNFPLKIWAHASLSPQL